MATFGPDDDLRGARFVDADLGGARFLRTNISGAVLREAFVDDVEIDAPWLAEGDGRLVVNGVDVVPLVEAELDRRFPGRALRTARVAATLREAWAALETTWARLLERVDAMPAGTVDECVDGEWTFAQTLRHLVLATDAWLGRSILHLEQPFHPLGLAGAGTEDDDLDRTLLTTGTPTYDEVLEARASRQALVRDFLATAADDDLATQQRNPWGDYPETTLSCLHTILDEEWSHQRYAVRDLDAVESRATAGSD
ncbi:MAG: DinB family protein [Candidatus Nanopelagicales bacterium]